MATWPSIAEPSSIDEERKKAVFRATSDAGYIQTRGKWTGSKSIFRLKWGGLSSADKATLKTFFDTNQGTSFDWTPTGESQLTCVFSTDSISFNTVGPGPDRWSTEVILEEQQ